MTAALSVRDLKVAIGSVEILRGIELEIPFGEVHAVMGPNGSGKSTLCHVLSGKPGYEVSGNAQLEGEDLLSVSIHERARMGLLQAFQYPTEIPGVTLREFLTEAGDEAGVEVDLAAVAERFGMAAFLDRSVNGGLSGGEKKKSEMVQVAALSPAVILLDEIDSGLDVDALREVASAVDGMRGPSLAVLMITHYSRILRYVPPDRVHVMMNGRIVESGGPELADELEAGGYEALRARLGLEAHAPEEEQKMSDLFTDMPFE